MRFHVSRAARERYQFDATLFAADGSASLADFHAARRLAARMNELRNLVSYPERAVQAGQVNAMGTIGEILRLIAGDYLARHGQEMMRGALDHLEAELGPARVDATLARFVDEFPPASVQQPGGEPAAFLAAETDGVTHRELILAELLQLWLANVNPAKSPFLELFDDENLERETPYLEVIAHLQEFFDRQPGFGPDQQSLPDMLRSPAIAVPHSLPGQLEFIRKKWGALLGKHYYRLLSSLDLLREEAKATFAGPGPSRAYEFRGLDVEPERFSADQAWMPHLVLLAKNVCVWLDQLSSSYRRSIARLDEIPDAELDTLQAWGITGLWLIGLWERSPASRRIKELCGNPNANASAYALYEYQIAGDLGGETAFAELRERAERRGIRLASDMVPNHTGLDSRWVIEHPDWFLSLPSSPFPSYSFGGEDLSSDPGVGLQLEDHYYSREDAAVVFQRVDRRSGDTRYVYHGNDGTNMPWNDTAQLDYLNPEVREAVIQTILDVARRVPVIRFDAAMTLARKHFHRLWFPEPGTGGAIPSRSEHGLSKPEFAERMPAEFWREVVDRVAAECPGTLLLAEAFWLMEGYFVRSLGMHRVYNSAFMTMLRDEQNGMYRSVMKNTLEFEPEILKRYVNFMSNPDERTAIDQFGGGDKYFGVCTLMVTLPGLPMFAHGQVEGLAEKYGMEYRHPLSDESSDQHLIERHRQEIFTLLERRQLFAEVDEFLFYDFETFERSVNEDVFAYSNRAGAERSLVVYHNRFSDTRGRLRQSVPFAVKGGGDQSELRRRTLADGLDLGNDASHFAIFRDQVSRLEFIRNCAELHERGLAIELGAYERHVFLDFREVEDDAWHHYAQLCAMLDGRGVPSIAEASRELLLQPVHRPFRELASRETLEQLLELRESGGTGATGTAGTTGATETTGATGATGATRDDVLAGVGDSIGRLLREACAVARGTGDPQVIGETLARRTVALLDLPGLERKFAAGGESTRGTDPRPAIRYLLAGLDEDRTTWLALFGWLWLHALGEVTGRERSEEQSRTWIDEWSLGRILSSALGDLGLDEVASDWALARIKVLTSHQHWYRSAITEQDPAPRLLESLLQDPAALHLLQVNRHQGILWFNKESFEELVWWLFAVATVAITASADATVSRGADATASRGADATASRGADATASRGADATASRGADATDARKADATSDRAADPVIDPILDPVAALIACHDLARDLLTRADRAGYQVEKLFQ